MDKFEALSAELHTEYPRWLSENYTGVIFHHPKDLQKVKDLVEDWFDGDFEYNYCERQRRFVFGKDNKNSLYLSTTESPRCHHNWAAMQFTSMIVHSDCFGLLEDGVFNPVGTVPSSEFLLYMLSRLRTRSKFTPRLVVC